MFLQLLRPFSLLPSWGVSSLPKLSLGEGEVQPGRKAFFLCLNMMQDLFLYFLTEKIPDCDIWSVFFPLAKATFLWHEMQNRSLGEKIKKVRCI